MLFFVQATAGNVELMWSLVAGIAVSGIPVPVPVVVETAFIERPVGGRPKPKVIVDACRDCTVVKKPERVSRLKSQASRHIDFAEFAIMQKFHRCIAV